MKRLLIMMTSAVLLISCDERTDSSGSPDESDNMTVARSNSENSREIYRAIETGDVSNLDSIIDENIIDHNAGADGKDIMGRDSVKYFISQIHNYFDGLKVEHVSDATSADGNYHFALVRMTGKTKENPWGMPVGMDMDDTMVDVVKMKDGMAIEHWGFMSQQDHNEMMGSMSGTKPQASDTTRK
jgi:predicted SnoaL-like aldol condensation-catalyzing enzyme